MIEGTPQPDQDQTPASSWWIAAAIRAEEAATEEVAENDTHTPPGAADQPHEPEVPTP